MEGISKKAAVFDIQKLEWMNGQYISVLQAEKLFGMVIDKYISDNLLDETPSGDKKEHLLAVIDLVKQRCRFVNDVVEQSRYFFDVELEYEEKALKKHWKENTAVLLEKFLASLQKLQSWDEQSLESSLRGTGRNGRSGGGKNNSSGQTTFNRLRGESGAFRGDGSDGASTLCKENQGWN